MPGILDHRDLVAHLVHHLRAFIQDEAVRFGVIVELGSGISMRQRNLDGFAIQFFREIDRAANRSPWSRRAARG